MKRKIYQELLQWKVQEQGAVALLIDGARRIGKSYIVEEFARKEYKTYLLIDFARAELDVKEYFKIYRNDLEALFMHLSMQYRLIQHHQSNGESWLP